MLRLNADGVRDDTFGIGGIALHDAGMAPVVNDAVVRSNGQVVVAGSARVAGRKQLALFRYQADASTASTPAQGFVVDRSRWALRLLRRVLGAARCCGRAT